jgi:hypothetical protein
MAASTTYQHALNKRRQLVGQLVEHYVDTKVGLALLFRLFLGTLAAHVAVAPPRPPTHHHCYLLSVLHSCKHDGAQLVAGRKQDVVHSLMLQRMLLWPTAIHPQGQLSADCMHPCKPLPDL